MRIGFFTETYYPTPDGVSHYLRDLKSELEKMGHEVFVFSLTGDKTEKNVIIPLSFPIVSYKQYRMPVNFFPVILYKKILKLKLDIVHIHDSFFMGSIGFRIGRAKNIPIVATFHTDFSRMRDSIKLPFKDYLFRLSWRYNKYLYKRCKVVFCPSKVSMETMKQSGVNNASMLPLFVDTEKFTPMEKDRNKFIIQYVGRITKDKGVRRIIEVAEFFRNREDIEFLISGTGPDEDYIINEISKRGLENMVRATGFVSEEEKKELYSKSFLFMYPSESDTFGLSVLEALSSGVPAIVAKDFPLIGCCSRNEEHSLITEDFSDPESVYRRIEELIKAPDRYRDLSISARNFAINVFSRTKHVEELLKTYDKIINGI